MRFYPRAINNTIYSQIHLFSAESNWARWPLLQFSRVFARYNCVAFMHVISAMNCHHHMTRNP